MSKKDKYNDLNGLRVISRPLSDSRDRRVGEASSIVYCGFQIAVGTRDEQPGEEGLAHFCEHITFKGTEHRSAMQIINCLESVGGELNAFTNKETTVFYAAIQREYVNKAVDLLCDIVFHSTYPQSEIDKEVEVICDEIESYNDSPAELIYDEFENIIFSGHPLGHNILGTAERVRSFTHDDAMRFTKKFYRPDNAVFFVYGDVDSQKIYRQLAKNYECRIMNAECSTPNSTLHNSEFCIHNSALTNSNSEFCIHNSALTNSNSNSEFCILNSALPIVREKGTHQAHVMIGTRAYGMWEDERQRMALYLINNILGGPGMNARLNLSLRERHGLVYTVESTMISYRDTGIWSTYFGCDPHDVNRCLRLVRKELDRLVSRPLTATQLAKAKRQIKGQLALACDNRENFALDLGKNFLLFGKDHDLNALYARIERVSAEDIQKVARELFVPEQLTTLIYR